MRAFRAAAAVALSAVVLAGCGPSGPRGGDDAPPEASAEPGASPTATGSPVGSAGPGPTVSPTTSPTTSPTAGRVPAPGETLVRVTRSGGFAGETHTLIVKGDGSWTRLDAEAEPEGTGTLSGARLATLRTALREADFARLPRVSTGGPKIYDGFVYAFVHGGFEVAAEDGSLPQPLTRVLDALPSFTRG